MPSIDIEVAFVVRQLNCTWSPAEITVGVAVSCAVGAPTATGGASAGGGNGAAFFLQPATAIKATNKTIGTRIRLRWFNGMLLLRCKSFTWRYGL